MLALLEWDGMMFSRIKVNRRSLYKPPPKETSPSERFAP